MDILVFSGALLTVIMMLIIIYMLSGQSKLKTLVTNIALQHVKAIETANPDIQSKNCDSGLLKLMIVVILILVIILILRKLRKSGLFRGHLFSNMVKIKLFITDTQSYVPIDLNKIAGHVHLFKLTGELALDKVKLRDSWIWDALEIDWSDVCMSLNEKEINLPISLLIPLVYKLKIRSLFKNKNPLHLYIMLKQRKSSFNLEKTMIKRHLVNLLLFCIFC